MSEGKFDPHRRLCPDGACIGVIGTDGRCRVCGRTAGGGKDAAPVGFVPAALDDESESDGENDGENGDEKSAGAPGAAGAPAAGAFDPNRRLCPDGGCIGVLGADGVCNVCGQKAD